MNIEITGFDLLEDSGEILRAKLRLRLTEVVIEEFPIYAWRKNGRWFFSIPKKAGISPTTGEKEELYLIGSANEKELKHELGEKLDGFIIKKFDLKKEYTQ